MAVIVTVDLEQLADLTRAEAGRHPARTPERRAAAHLWAALVTTNSAEAARRAIGTFGTGDVQAAAAALLGRLATKAGRGGCLRG
jgi:hypothetical protein